MSASLDDGECDVFLCNRPIQENGSGKSASSVLSFLTSSSRSVYGDSWNKHWLVLFYYGGDDVTICEATKDTAEDLTAMRYWKKRTSEEVTRLSKEGRCEEALLTGQGSAGRSEEEDVCAEAEEGRGTKREGGSRRIVAREWKERGSRSNLPDENVRGTSVASRIFPADIKAAQPRLAMEHPGRSTQASQHRYRQGHRGSAPSLAHGTRLCGG